VWAAGNAPNPRAQVITAAGEGSAVGIAINTDLVQDDVDSTMQRLAARVAVPGGSRAVARISAARLIRSAVRRAR
jgi:hypothetical protein